MILFIKERIRYNIKLYKQKKSNPNDTTHNNNKKDKNNTISTGLENGVSSGNGAGVIDYGLLFQGGQFGNNMDLKQINESNLNNSQEAIEIDTQQSHRMLMTSSQSFHSRNMMQ